MVTLGDSLTEGWASTPNANARYPDQLARLLLDRYPGEPKKAVLNAGISGDGVLNPIWGPGMVARLDRDVLSQSGVTHVILQGAGNDINFSDLGWPDVSAEEIIAGYEEIITRVHARGLTILGGTTMPFKGFLGFWTPVKEAKRQAINDWIRNSQAFDGVIDFDAALRDPDDQERLHPVFDSGDHGHLNDAGYAVMAFEAELELINLRGGPW